jgi:hypothetical protein
VAFVAVLFGGGRRRFRGREILFSGVGGGQSVLPSRFVGGLDCLRARFTRPAAKVLLIKDTTKAGSRE